MIQASHRPAPNELWRLTGSIVVSPGGVEMIRIPAGTYFTVISRHEGAIGWESCWVLFSNGIAGTVSDHCTHMVRISDAAR